jgi:spore germination protein Q
MYSHKSWPAYTPATGAGTGYPGPMTGVGGVTGTMPNGGYTSPMTGVGGVTGTMPNTGYTSPTTGVGGVTGTMPNPGYPGPMTGVGGVTGTMPSGGGFPGMMPGAGYPGMMPGAGYPGTMPGVGGVTGTMPGVGGVTGTMPGAVPPSFPSGFPITPGGPAPGQEESYVENILRMNLGKVATIYMTFENNCEWNAKVFKGVLEAAGRDHIIISDPSTGKRYLLLTVNLDYITFDEPLIYTLPFGSTGTMGAMGITRSQ